MSKELETLLIRLLKIYFIYIPVLAVLVSFIGGFIKGFTGS